MLLHVHSKNSVSLSRAAICGVRPRAGIACPHHHSRHENALFGSGVNVFVCLTQLSQGSFDPRKSHSADKSIS